MTIFRLRSLPPSQPAISLETIAAFLYYRKKNEQLKQIEILKKHRHGLLDKIHEDQKAIDCLDYLLYKLK